MSTTENLQAAFAGESQANRRYLAFAGKAESDGFPQVARLFRAVAAAETIHAHAHLRALDGVANTEQNLEAAIGGEAYEFKQMYPGFIAEARQEGDKRAENSFKNAMTVEEIHHSLYAEALKAVQSGQDLPERKVHVCSVCGHTHYGDVPDRCPVCNAPRERFFAVD
jgi:rubrerythrin